MKTYYHPLASGEPLRTLRDLCDADRRKDLIDSTGLITETRNYYVDREGVVFVSFRSNIF